jgi:hypothetical protein
MKNSVCVIFPERANLQYNLLVNLKTHVMTHTFNQQFEIKTKPLFRYKRNSVKDALFSKGHDTTTSTITLTSATCGFFSADHKTTGRSNNHFM